MLPVAAPSKDMRFILGPVKRSWLEGYFFLPEDGADCAAGFFWLLTFLALCCAFFFWLFLGFESPIGGHSAVRGGRTQEGNARAARNDWRTSNALYSNSTGDNNTACGWEAMEGKSIGSYNIAIGNAGVGGGATPSDLARREPRPRMWR